MATNGNTAHPDHADAGNSNNPSKDEVGWYFVEQYYTTLSKYPEKLHLFYGKKSQFVYGQEAEVANVSVGRQAIQERVKQLDFQDCKVRISNVDAQGSVDNIVIQVIGETSNKSGEPRKFVQTFILAQQPSGYFVLNDILRFIKEETEEETADASAQPDVAIAEPTSVPAEIQPEQEAPKSVADTEESTQAQLDPAVVDKKLEEAGAEESQAASTVGSAAEPAPAQQAAPVATPAAVSSVPDPEKAAQEIAEEEAKKPETPKDPTPTPIPARAPAPAPAPAEPEKPKEPAKPMTWASRIAAAAGPPKPVVPLPKAAAPAAAQTKPAAAPAAAAAAAATAAAPAAAQPAAPAQPAETAAKDAGNEWQTAGADSKKQSRPQSISGPPQQEGCLGYVKYVTEKVQAADLKTALAKYGELVYFDINRMKNCAFVEFASPAGYQAAVAANPHTVNGESIVVEPRRPKAGAYGGSNYNQNRGSISGRGRGGFEGGRSGSQSGGRGGFGGQTRGRGGSSGAPRGRGPSQAANA